MLQTKTPKRFALTLLAATCLTPVAAAQAAPGDRLGPEFQVNTTTVGDQAGPAVAMDADGDFVVVWASYGQDGDGWGVFAQRYNASGEPQSGEFQVATTTAGNQRRGSVAMDADGDFVVTWDGRGPGDTLGIFARRYNAAGKPQDGEFQVSYGSNPSGSSPSVAMHADGDFVVVWIADQRRGSVAMDADGDFVVTWDGRGSGDTLGIFARRYSAAGEPQGGEFQVNTTTASQQKRTSVGVDPDGGFVVAWTSNGSPHGILAQRFDAGGTPQGSEFQVNTFVGFGGISGSGQTLPKVAMDADGDFVVAWTSYDQDGAGTGVFAQRFDAAGVAQGEEFQVNTFTEHTQTVPAVAMDADGDFVVAWQSYSYYQDDQDGDGSGVFAQRFDGAERVEGDFDGDGKADLLWHNRSTGQTSIWLMDGETLLEAGSIGRPPLAWRIAGTGDFNGDGKADILWHNSETGNTETGNTVVWQMDGLALADHRSIGAPPLAWTVEQLRDTNGDGLSDIVWRHSGTGATVVWRMSGFTMTAAEPIGKVASDWQVR